jgi:DNA-binding transcriptional LysR family regulator
MDHLQSVRIFVKVADVGSFVGAASAMDLSNTVVTRHIADLESRLGTRLIHRTTRSLSLTESGQVYLERVRQILDELEDVEQTVTARNHEPIGTLRIVAPVVFGLHALAPVLQDYAARYPKIVPDVTLVDRHVDLVEEGYDVGIVIARQMRTGSIVTRRLTTDCMAVCATPAYLAKHGVPASPEVLAHHACLSPPAELGGAEHVFSGPQGEVRVRTANVIAANNTEMQRQFALLGMGVAILPGYVVSHDLAVGRLVRLLDDYRLPHVEINVAYPSRRHLPAKVRTFIDHLVEHFARTALDAGELAAPRANGGGAAHKRFTADALDAVMPRPAPGPGRLATALPQ